jgi:rSAM/selenodomain-associated transferase 1
MGIERAEPFFYLETRMRQAMVLMAKAPQAGDVKTRLCPPLTLEAAAVLYRGFLLDSIAKIDSLRTAQPVMSYAPASGEAFFADAVPHWTRLPQNGADLGARMHHCFRHLFMQGYDHVLLTGSDLPTLPRHILRQAIRLAASPQIDVILGPSEDGGYYLIGLRAPCPALFESMTWSTSEVLAETVGRATCLGLRIAYLPTWYDVDTPADLIRLQAALTQPHTRALHHTRAFFASRP